MILFLIIVFISCFAIARAKTSYLLRVKSIFRSKIRLIIVITLINFFNVLTTYKYFILLIFFLIYQFLYLKQLFLSKNLKSNLWLILKLVSFTSFYLSNFTFFDTI